MCLSLLRQLALYICIIYGTTGPADVPQDGGDDEVHVGEAVLFPGTTEVWTSGPANVKVEGGQVLLPVAGAS